MSVELGRIRDVSFVAGGRVVLSGVTFDMLSGVRSVIVGANGAGKSVLMRLCHGLLQPSAGHIEWHPAARRQAMVFQRPVLLRRSVIANVAYALGLAGVPWSGRRALAMSALERVGLDHLAHRAARTLSGGEQQRVALARAWALEPAVLFLDEPTASLDPGAAAAIERVVDEFHRRGTKIVMVTHNLGQARRLADEILFIHAGRLAERAAADDFFHRPASPEAQAFLQGELPWR